MLRALKKGEKPRFFWKTYLQMAARAADADRAQWGLSKNVLDMLSRCLQAEKMAKKWQKNEGGLLQKRLMVSSLKTKFIWLYTSSDCPEHHGHTTSRGFADPSLLQSWQALNNIETWMTLSWWYGVASWWAGMGQGKGMELSWIVDTHRHSADTHHCVWTDPTVSRCIGLHRNA